MLENSPNKCVLKIMYLTDDKTTCSRVESALMYNNVDALCCCDDDIAVVLDFALKNINDCDGLILDLLWSDYPDEKYLGLTYLYPKILPVKPKNTIVAILTRHVSDDGIKPLLRRYDIHTSLLGDALNESHIRTVIGNLLRRLGVQDVNFPGQRL